MEKIGLSKQDLEKLKKSSEDNITEHKKMLALNELMLRVAEEEINKCPTETTKKEEEKSMQ